MPQAPNIDGVLIQWGDRLFYPSNRIVKTKPAPKLNAIASSQRAAAIRERIAATVVRRAPQVMVKVTGGGHCMKAIAAHFRYISKNGRRDLEDERARPCLAKTACKTSPTTGALAAASLKTLPSPVSGAKRSTSCCRCRVAPTL